MSRPAIFVIMIGVAVLILVGPAQAQDDQEAPGHQVESDFNASETENEIRAIRWTLVGIAVGTGVMLVTYVWHTNPHRRLRAATYRLQREKASGGKGEAFLLPGDVDPSAPHAERT